MARKTILISDLSGEEIPEGKGAVLRVVFNDARKGVAVLEISEKEADDFAKKGRKTARRGRKPAAA